MSQTAFYPLHSARILFIVSILNKSIYKSMKQSAGSEIKFEQNPSSAVPDQGFVSGCAQHQNDIFNANWSTLGSLTCAGATIPNWLLAGSVLGPPNLGWFNRLNASPRSCAFHLSVSWKFLYSPKFISVVLLARTSVHRVGYFRRKLAKSA